jgi:hypothetical protein
MEEGKQKNKRKELAYAVVFRYPYPMDNNEVSTEIINSLSKGQDSDDIILTLCEKNNLPWQDAENLVHTVQTLDKKEITKKQFPLLFSLALAVFMGGIVAVGYGCLIIFSEYRLIQHGLTSIHKVINDMDTFANFYYGLRMIFSSGGTPISMIIFGIGMILGSLVGMRDAWSDILG